VVYFDGRANVDKSYESQRRQDLADNARADNNLRGQIRNTSEYIAKAVAACRFLNIECHVAAYEADPQVTYLALSRSLIPMTGDSDILAYGAADLNWKWKQEGSKQLEKVILVAKYRTEWYRIIDLHSDVPVGEYPLFDLYRNHGRIVFQLFAGCSGCDFTKFRSGIPGIGIKTFLALANKMDLPLSSPSMAKAIIDNVPQHAEAAGLRSFDELSSHFQHVIDIYTLGKLYNKESGIIDMRGILHQPPDSKSKRHMHGSINSRTLQEFDQSLSLELKNFDCSLLLHQSAADTSTIRGISLPLNKTPEQCTVAQLRDMVLARGGTVLMNKPELIHTVKQYCFIEKQVAKTYVDRNPDPNGRLYASIDSISTHTIGAILTEVNEKLSGCGDANDDQQLIEKAHSCFNQGLFDGKFDNISRIAPELKQDLIYREFGHVGSSIKQKGVGNALQRCFYDDGTSYHGLAFVPDSDKILIMSKCHASMARDEKTRKKTADGEMPKKKEYLLIMELQYKKTDMIENGHDLGIFVKLTQSYCTSCVAGQGLCRHRGERLWYQYHHWTEERLGVDRPPALDVCGWSNGGKALSCDVRQKIHEQQSVKMAKTLVDQTAKINRSAKRDCTEGNSCDYQVHLSDKKQKHSDVGRLTVQITERTISIIK